MAKETVRTAITDGEWNNKLLSVVQSTSDPTKYGLVICNPDGTPISWWGGWGITETSVNTLTNKTLDDYTNFIHADWIHLRVKATETLVKWDVIKFVWFNAWQQAIEVAKRNSTAVPAIWIVDTPMSTGDFWMAVSNWLFKWLDTSAFSEGTVLYPNTSGWFTATNPWWYAQQIAYVVRSHAVNGEVMINVWPVYGTDKRSLGGNAGTTAGTDFIGTTDAQELIFKTNSIQRFRLTTGLNTNKPIAQITSPIADLNTNPMNSIYMQLGGLEYWVNTYRVIWFWYSWWWAPAYFWYQEKNSSGNTYGDLVWGVQNTGGAPSESMRLFSSGNLGLGTATDAGYKLDVNGTARIATSLNVGSTSGNDGVNITRSGSGQGLITSWSYTPTDPIAGISPGANFGFNGSSSNFYGIGLSSLRSSAYDIWFQTGATNGGGYRWYIGTSEKMTMFNDGSVGIGTTTNVASSALTIASTTKGFLPPRMTNSQRTAITSPTTGLIVYQTDWTEWLYERTASGWRIINWGWASNGQITNKSSNGSFGTWDTTIHANTTSWAITVTLPDPTTSVVDYNYNVKIIAGTNNININPFASETIDWVSSFTISTPTSKPSVSFYTDGTDRFIR